MISWLVQPVDQIAGTELIVSGNAVDVSHELRGERLLQDKEIIEQKFNGFGMKNFIGEN